MKELELALLQYQQNIEIPEVNLVFHPVIQRAANLVRELHSIAVFVLIICDGVLNSSAVVYSICNRCARRVCSSTLKHWAWKTK